MSRRLPVAELYHVNLRPGGPGTHDWYHVEVVQVSRRYGVEVLDPAKMRLAMVREWVGDESVPDMAVWHFDHGGILVYQQADIWPWPKPADAEAHPRLY